MFDRITVTRITKGPWKGYWVACRYIGRRGAPTGFHKTRARAIAEIAAYIPD